MGAKKPLRLRLLVMTWVTPTATSPSDGVPATKLGIAIGSGAKSPSGMMRRFCPKALRTPPLDTPSAAIPESICRRLRRNDISRNPFLSVIAGLHFMSEIVDGDRLQVFRSVNTGAKYFHSSK